MAVRGDPTPQRSPIPSFLKDGTDDSDRGGEGQRSGVTQSYKVYDNDAGKYITFSRTQTARKDGSWYWKYEGLPGLSEDYEGDPSDQENWGTDAGAGDPLPEGYSISTGIHGAAEGTSGRLQKPDKSRGELTGTVDPAVVAYMDNRYGEGNWGSDLLPGPSERKRIKDEAAVAAAAKAAADYAAKYPNIAAAGIPGIPPDRVVGGGGRAAGGGRTEWETGGEYDPSDPGAAGGGGGTVSGLTGKKLLDRMVEDQVNSVYRSGIYPNMKATDKLNLQTRLKASLGQIGGIYPDLAELFGMSGTEDVMDRVEQVLEDLGGWNSIIHTEVGKIHTENRAKFVKLAGQEYDNLIIGPIQERLDALKTLGLTTSSDYIELEMQKNTYTNHRDFYVQLFVADSHSRDARVYPAPSREGGVFKEGTIDPGWGNLWKAEPPYDWKGEFSEFFMSDSTNMGAGLGEDTGVSPSQAQERWLIFKQDLRSLTAIAADQTEWRLNYRAAVEKKVDLLDGEDDSLILTLRGLLAGSKSSNYAVLENRIKDAITDWSTDSEVDARFKTWYLAKLSGDPRAQSMHESINGTLRTGVMTEVAGYLNEILSIGKTDADGNPANAVVGLLGLSEFTGDLVRDLAVLNEYKVGYTKWKKISDSHMEDTGAFNLDAALKYAFSGNGIAAESAITRAKNDVTRGPGGADVLAFRDYFNAQLIKNGLTPDKFKAYAGISVDDIIALKTDSTTGHFDKAAAEAYLPQFMNAAVNMNKSVKDLETEGKTTALMLAGKEQQVRESIEAEKLAATERGRLWMSTNLADLGITADEAVGSMVSIDPDDPDSPKEWQWAPDLGADAIALMEGRDLATDPTGKAGLTQLLLRSASFRLLSREYGMTPAEWVDLALNGGLNPVTGEEMEGVEWVDSPAGSSLENVLTQNRANIAKLTRLVSGMMRAGEEEVMRLTAEDTTAADAFNNQGIRKPDGTMWTPEDMRIRRQGARGQTGVTVPTTGRGGDQFPGGRYTGEAARTLIFNQVYGGGRAAGAPDSAADLTDAQIQHGLSRLPGLGIAPAVIEMIGQVALHGTGTKPTTYAKPTDQLGWEAYGRTREQLEEQGLTVSEIEDILTRQKEAVDEYGRGVQRQETAAGAPDTGTTPDTAGGERKTAQTIAGPTVQQIHEDLPVPGNRFPRR